jgi:hypothetical protein
LQDNTKQLSAITQLEDRINALQLELQTLRNKTNLQAVQDKLDSFMDEVRLIHRGLLVTLQEMINGLNAEGVKRYEGAVRQVNENTTKQVAEIIKEVKEISKRLDKFSMMV